MKSYDKIISAEIEKISNSMKEYSNDNDSITQKFNKSKMEKVENESSFSLFGNVQDNKGNGSNPLPSEGEEEDIAFYKTYYITNNEKKIKEEKVEKKEEDKQNEQNKNVIITNENKKIDDIKEDLNKDKVIDIVIEIKYSETYDLKCIIEILQKKYNLEVVIDILLKNKVSEKLMNKIKGIPFKRHRRKAKEIKKDIEKKEIKKGRKVKGSTDVGSHTKNFSDNIMSKVRALLINYVVNSVNIILKKENSKYRLKKLNAKNMNNLRRDDNLKYLEMTLEDFLSQDISPKNNNYPKDENKKIILKIKKEQKLKSLFKLTFGEWMNIFLMKEKKNEFEFEGLDLLLTTLLHDNEDNEQYFVDCVFIIYNYERWFYMKKVKNITNDNK